MTFLISFMNHLGVHWHQFQKIRIKSLILLFFRIDFCVKNHETNVFLDLAFAITRYNHLYYIQVDHH